MPAFNSIGALEAYIKSALNIAMKNVCEIMADKLSQHIQADYYDQYSPRIYKRTYQFLDSVVYNMLGSGYGEVFVNTGSMNYEDATGKYVADLASMGLHGNPGIQTSGRFFDSFLDECDKAFIINQLKIELGKQGIKAI